tara:strand:+ start:1634 stop:1816 length:183 start_codon:yes stop_codon:yes gene_type:complete
MNERVLQKTSEYNRNDLIEIIQCFAESCSERACDPEFAGSLADKYDPIFNCEEEDEDEEI